MGLRVNFGQRLRSFQHNIGNIGPSALHQAFCDLEKTESLILINLREGLGAGFKETLDLAPTGINQGCGKANKRGLVIAYQREYLLTQGKTFRSKVIGTMG